MGNTPTAVFPEAPRANVRGEQHRRGDGAPQLACRLCTHRGSRCATMKAGLDLFGLSVDSTAQVVRAGETGPVHWDRALASLEIGTMLC